MSPKTVVSLLFVKPGQIGGVEHFCRNLLKGFILAGAPDRFILLVPPALPAHPDWQQLLAYFECELIEPGANARFTEFFSTRLSNNLHLNLNYVTPLFARQNITVIHDALFRHFKGYFSQTKYLWLSAMQRLSINRANAIVCISHAVKQDLMRPGHIPEVIYNPIDFERFQNWEAPIVDKQIRLSCLAANYPHKNLESIILATDLLRAQGIDATLTLIGQKPVGLGGGNFGAYGQKIANLLEGKQYIQATGYLSDTEVSATLGQSHLFLFPSLFEGFGMPPVEMLATEMPCVVSDLPVLREVTQGNAKYVQQPTDPAQWAASILDAIHHYQDYCQAARAAKSALVEAYHCKHIANQYLGLIEKISG